ncbi:hypothetical protein EVAR_60239_1 [Eumeta japonica]|uniref:Uncharacterized protein n=1 Tax=Eumeta variegata TaxID=151549 RepID=A0A4C1ZRR6_EUMVA|nr:hypothetical protein EVAR_60239_1 [Eumeta japonica]
MQSFKHMLFIVEEFNHKKKSSWQHRPLAFRRSILIQSITLMLSLTTSVVHLDTPCLVRPSSSRCHAAAKLGGTAMLSPWRNVDVTKMQPVMAIAASHDMAHNWQLWYL